MYKLILTSFLCLFSFAQAQITLKMNYFEEANWDQSIGSWNVFNEFDVETSITINEEFTVLYHDLGNKVEKYTIVDWTYDDDEMLMELIIKNNADNEYEMLIDLLNNYVIYFWFDENDVYQFHRYTIYDSN